MNSPSTATPTKPVGQASTATKPETVQAVAMTAPGQTEMRTYPYPTMDHDSAILKVDMSGICGTDRHIYKGEATELRGKSIFPYVGGHEVIGTIVEIGDNAAKVNGIRQAAACGWRSCIHRGRGQLRSLLTTAAKHYNNTTCLNQIQAYGLHPNCETKPYLRGGFAEYMYIRPGTHLFKVPEEMPTDIAVFVEEMAVAYHSLGRAAGPFAPVNEGFGPGQSVAILGNGPLGILHGIMASIHGAGLRIATDLSDLRLGIAKGLYADVTLNASEIPEEERIAQVQDMTEGVGPDLVIESAGEPEAFIEALKMVRKGGTVIEVGNWVDLGKPVNLDVMQHISSKNLHIHSVFHCGTDWGPVLKILQQQSDRYDFPSLITHRFGLDELVEKFGTVTKFDECCKIEVVPHK